MELVTCLMVIDHLLMEGFGSTDLVKDCIHIGEKKHSHNITNPLTEPNSGWVAMCLEKRMRQQVLQLI